MHSSNSKHLHSPKTFISNLFNGNDFSKIPLKLDHCYRPLWINPVELSITLEKHSPLAKPAQDFLAAIAEPISRPMFMLEYKITSYSLYAAFSIGLQANDIIIMLNRLSKSEIQPSVVEFINKCSLTFSKAKLVLKLNRYFIESEDQLALKKLLLDEIIRDACINLSDNQQDNNNNKDINLISTDKPSNKGLLVAGIPNKIKTMEDNKENIDGNESIELDIKKILDKEDEEDEEDIKQHVYSFEIDSKKVETIKKQCQLLDYPLLEEYDFRNDTINTSLEIELKPNVTLRPYQEKSLNKKFSNGRARSGIIVLPCGAGKTLVGIAAACTIKKSCLILCTSAVSVSQWKSELLKWSTIQPEKVATFTSGHKEFYAGKIGIVITTYSMVANIKNRSHSSKKMMDYLQNQEWGLLLLDEVHVVPANMFRQVVNKIHCHSKLGLTATLVREDDKITDLNFLIGPKLYEANWMELASQGHIANVECAEVWCPMTREFYREYLHESSRKRALLYAMNPSKFQACQYLIQLHESRGDKIIVFSDNVYALQAYALKLKKPFIYGATSQLERIRILQQFKYNPMINTVFLSKVGDTSIDLPEATVLIQISAHYGSRRQEAQRLGRILRAKKKTRNVTSKFNAFFYSLVSKDTVEMYYSGKRQQFLIDQGYAFKIITKLDGINELENLVYPTQSDQLELLQTVLMTSEKDGESEDDNFDFDFDFDFDLDNSNMDSLEGDNLPLPKRMLGSMKSLAGADSMAYIEYNRPVAHQFRDKENQLFRKKSKK
ncbi:DNA repair helicase rad25 [Neoconidiobolus thromboides FSU 785]|nr:DNA repair helicase rad25 [Neoconidiobolus thromboides FSU 785]